LRTTKTRKCASLDTLSAPSAGEIELYCLHYVAVRLLFVRQWLSCILHTGYPHLPFQDLGIGRLLLLSLNCQRTSLSFVTVIPSAASSVMLNLFQHLASFRIRVIRAN